MSLKPRIVRKNAGNSQYKYNTAFLLFHHECNKNDMKRLNSPEQLETILQVS